MSAQFQAKRHSIVASLLNSFFEAIRPQKELSEIAKLETALEDRQVRDELINQLLSAHLDGIIQVRFISAVKDFEHTENKEEKESKGKHICALFVKDGSKFHLHGIPIDIQRDMIKSKFRNLILIKKMVLQELSENPVVIAFMNSSALLKNDLIPQSCAD
jgi:hypothetical protein